MFRGAINPYSPGNLTKVQKLSKISSISKRRKLKNPGLKGVKVANFQTERELFYTVKMKKQTF